MNWKYLLVIGAALFSLSVCADVFKCVDVHGRASYQDTSCPAGKSSVAIDRRHSNQLDLRIPAADRKQILKITAATKKARQEKAEARNAQISKTLEKIRVRQSQCKSLKADYEAMHIRRRRYGRSDPDAESDLIRRMNRACSG